MPNAVQAVFLGVVQGLTEFLPVSSSAHLILARLFLGFDQAQFGLPFDVAVHVGTLAAVLVYFRRDMARLAAAAVRVIRGGVVGSTAGYRLDVEVRTLWLLAVGTIPVAIVGAFFGDAIEAVRSPQVVVATLTLGAGAFFAVERVGQRQRSVDSLSVLDVWWIGCAQAVSLIPGVSRSGATMTVAMLLGLGRPDAARFAFLLGVPAISGAAVKKVFDLGPQDVGPDTATLFLVGVATSAVVGYLAIRFFIRYLAKHSLDVFGWYRIALAATVVLWLWRGE
jgi:undecaprenyl-diphosphatase